MSDDNTKDIDKESNDPLMDHAGPILKTMLQNQRRWIQYIQAEKPEHYRLTTAFNYDDVVAGLVNNWGIQNLIGVQPMTGPVGVAYRLGYCYDPMDEDTKIEQGDDTYLSLDVVTHAIEARTKKLSSSWTLEALQDSHTGAEKSYSNLSDEIATEYCQEVIRDLINISEEVIVDTEFDATHAISCELNKARTNIAIRSRRGAGNWMVVGPSMLAFFLDDTKKSGFVKGRNSELDGSALRHVGTHNETCKVFYDPHMNNQQVLMGYKGSSEVDCGYIVCPYIGIVTTGAIVNPITFEPTIGFMTRAGKLTFASTLDKTRTSNDYYTTITFSKLPMSPLEEESKAVDDLLTELSRWDERKVSKTKEVNIITIDSTRAYEDAMKSLIQT